MLSCYFFKEGSKINQVFMAILIIIPVFCYGTAIGWMSPMTLLLQSKDSPAGRPMTDAEISWMASTCFLISVPSNIMFAFIMDKWGRKITVLIVSTTLAACWITKLLSTALWAFILARCMVGIAMSGSYMFSLIYVKEISEDSIRGALASLGILAQTIGNLLLYILGDLLSYRAVLWFCLSIPVVHFLLFLMMPESPAYLIKKGRNDEALRVVAWLRNRKETDPIVAQDTQLIKEEQDKYEQHNKFVLKSVLTAKLLRRAFYIALILTMAREVCGVVAVVHFAGDIFKQASKGGHKLILEPNQQAILVGVVQVIGCAFASSLIEKTGRKPLLSITSLFAGLSMLALASWFLALTMGSPGPAWVPIVTLCLCIFCDAAGLQPVCFVVLSELFAYQFRSSVTAVVFAISDLLDFLQMLLFKQVSSHYGAHVAFFFFAGASLLSALYILVMVPETKMKTLDEIYEQLKTKKERMMEKV